MFTALAKSFETKIEEGHIGCAGDLFSAITIAKRIASRKSDLIPIVKGDGWRLVLSR